MAHPVRPEIYKEINNFYTSTVYEKGAEVVRMVQTLIGREKFRAGMDLYFARHDGHAATVEQFIQCFADAQRPRHDAVHALVQPGRHAGGDGHRPLRCRRARPTRSNAKQTVPPTPGQPTKQPMVIPLALGLVGKDGRDLPLVRRRRKDRARRAGAERAGSTRSNSPASPSARCCRSTAASRRRSSLTPISTATISLSSPRTTAMRSIAGRRCRPSRCGC